MHYYSLRVIAEGVGIEMNFGIAHSSKLYDRFRGYSN
jgi:hypothetical protein